MSVDTEISLYLLSIMLKDILNFCFRKLNFFFLMNITQWANTFSDEG
jgi:hypothetical protein